MTGQENSWSPPIKWIVGIVCAAVLLAFLFSWWWILVPVVLYFAVAIISIVLRGRDDTTGGTK